MQKMIIAAIVLLLAQIGLSVALNLGNKGINEGTPDSLFLSFKPEEVHSLEITGGEGKSLVIKKDTEGWLLPAHFSAPVDKSKVTALLDKLAGAKQGFVVATSDEAAKRFKVDSKGFERHVVFTGEGKPLADFYVGTSPIFRQVHARRADNTQIVTIPLSTFELDNTVDKWLDKSLATIKDEDLVGLTIGDLHLKKSDDGWQLDGLKDGEKLNSKEVDTLVTKVRGLSVLDVFDPAEVADSLTDPVFRFTTVQKGNKEVEYRFAKAKDNFYVLKMSNRNMYFKVLALPVETIKLASREKLVEKAPPAEPAEKSVSAAAPE